MLAPFLLLPMRSFLRRNGRGKFLLVAGLAACVSRSEPPRSMPGGYCCTDGHGAAARGPREQEIGNSLYARRRCAWLLYKTICSAGLRRAAPGAHPGGIGHGRSGRDRTSSRAISQGKSSPPFLRRKDWEAYISHQNESCLSGIHWGSSHSGEPLHIYRRF